MKKLFTIISSVFAFNAVGQVNVGVEFGTNVSAGASVLYKLKSVENISPIIGIGGIYNLSVDTLGKQGDVHNLDVKEWRKAIRKSAKYETYYGFYATAGIRMDRFELSLRGGAKYDFYFANRERRVPKSHTAYFSEWTPLVGGTMAIYFNKVGATIGYDNFNELVIGIKYQF